jgi:hypothetical protein
MALICDLLRMVNSFPISIRLSDGDADVAAVRRVAERDSRPVPEGPLLLAEVGGEVRAALSLTTGDAVADPFAPTAAVVDLMRLRARQVGTVPGPCTEPGSRRGFRVRPRRAPATA